MVSYQTKAVCEGVKGLKLQNKCAVINYCLTYTVDKKQFQVTRCLHDLKVYALRLKKQLTA